jgi:serine phosphatase RsbU (regulator of sigma subunit)
MAGSSVFPGSGSLRASYEAVDWSATRLGPAKTWSEPLRGALSLILTTRFPATLFWGPELVLLYNEAYLPLIEDKHPAALGAPAREVFPEIWDTIGPMLDGVLAGNGPTWVEDERLFMRRRGFLEECYFTFSYSPVLDDTGAVAGVLDLAAETTARVVDRRRLELVARLADGLRDLSDPKQVLAVAAPLLRSAPADLPEVHLLGAGVDPAHRPAQAKSLRVKAPIATDPRRAREIVLEAGPAGALAIVPLDSGTRTGDGPVLAVRLSEHLAPDESYLEFLRLLGATLSTALGVAEARQAEHQVALADRTMSEALQRSLLTEPVQPEGIEIIARYAPAASEAEVGGDWYDAFRTGDGRTCLVIGDVTGHDQDAAALMGQVRNVLRGVAYTIPAPPAAVLTALDTALRGLGVHVLTTTVLAVVDGSAPGPYTLCWSNAGHPPPLLIGPDGATRLLDTRPDLLLGVDVDTDRRDHTVELPAGTTVLFYTDGLVERRGAGLEKGLAWLVDAAAERSDRSLEDLCDDLVFHTVEQASDDIAILAIRVR